MRSATPPMVVSGSTAGFENAGLHQEAGTSTFSSVEAFIRAQTAILLAGHDTQALIADTTEIFAAYIQPNGSIHIPSPGNIAAAIKA